jgi:hypothetical protein
VKVTASPAATEAKPAKAAAPAAPSAPATTAAPAAAAPVSPQAAVPAVAAALTAPATLAALVAIQADAGASAIAHAEAPGQVKKQPPVITPPVATPPVVTPPVVTPPVVAPPPVDASAEAATPALLDIVRQDLATPLPQTDAHPKLSAAEKAFRAAAEAQHLDALKTRAYRNVMRGQAALALLALGQDALFARRTAYDLTA